MAKRESLAEDIYKVYVVVVFLVVAFYFSEFSLILKFGVWFIFVFTPVFFLIAYKKRKRADFFNTKNTLEKIKDMQPGEFEEFIVHIFRKLGYRAKKVGGAYDGGIDVILKKDGDTQYIQCKKYITRQVSVGDVRDFYGAMMGTLSFTKGYFITTNVFTFEAEKFAEGKNIELVDGKRLMEYVRLAGMEAELSHHITVDDITREACPRCGSRLVLRQAHKGAYAGNKFYGCSSYPKCKYIKTIG